MVYNVHLFFLGAFKQCSFVLNFDYLAPKKSFFKYQIVLFSKKSPKIEIKKIIAMFLLCIKKLKKITLWTKLCMKKCLIMYPVLLMVINSLLFFNEYGYRNIIHTMEFNKLDKLFIKCSN